MINIHQTKQEEEIGSLPEKKKIQNNDSKHDPNS